MLRTPAIAVRFDIRALSLALLAIATFALAAAAPAAGADRARLTWDTDRTDIDLHIWDSAGNHAWYADREDIPDATLSTDIIYGFGPEHFVEEFAASGSETYTYGVCYYGSNTDDGSVPETVATVELTDPGGSTRTLRRTLRTEKEAYYLGSSPQGPGYEPADDWCSAGPYHPASDTGPATDTAVGGGGQFEGCPRVRRRIGVVELCSNTFDGGGPRYTASGNVRVNGSVYLGEGPVTVDVSAGTITANSSTIAVMRGAQPLPIAGGNLVIDTDAVSDEVSGRDRLAAMTVTNARADLTALRLAGLPIGVDLPGGALALFLDRREGGGILARASVALPFAANQRSAGALTAGIHGSSATAVRVLGGSASFGTVALPGGWGLEGFALTYQEARNVWFASGALKTPFLGLGLSGGLADGQLNEVGLTLAGEAPIGLSGFVLTKLGGRVAGLSQPPLKIEAIASARWGKVPALDAAVLLLNDVTLGVDLAGNASLDGSVAFLRNPSPVTGRIDIDFAISPFRASGRLTADATVGPLAVSAGGGVIMRTNALTAAGSAQGRFRGVKLSSARGVLSNKGLGVTGRMCIWRSCSDVGAGMNWSDFPRVRYIGGDVNQFVTASSVASAAASGRSRTIRVRSGRPFLFIDADGRDGTRPAFKVRAPGGRTYTTGVKRKDSRIVKDRATGFTGLTIARPRPGRWRITPVGSARTATRFAAQTIRRIKRVRVTSLKPRGSKRKALSRRKGAAIKVRWSSRGLPSRARVNIYVTPSPGKLGQYVTGGKRARRGVARIPRKLLRKGRNRVRLVVISGGIAIDDVVAKGVIRAK